MNCLLSALLFLSSFLVLAGVDDGMLDKQSSDLKSYIQTWKLSQKHDAKTGDVIAATIARPIIKDHVKSANLNWEAVAIHLFPEVQEAVGMLTFMNKGIAPQGVSKVKEFLQEEYLFDQFSDFETVDLNSHHSNTIDELSGALGKIEKGDVVVIVLDGLVLETEADTLKMLPCRAKVVISAMIEKGAVVFGYTNTGFQGTSRISSFLESNDIRFSRLDTIQTIGFYNNIGIHDGILAGSSLTEVVQVFKKVNEACSLALGNTRFLTFITDKDVIAHKIHDEAQTLKLNTLVLQCLFIPDQDNIRKFEND